MAVVPDFIVDALRAIAANDGGEALDQYALKYGLAVVNIAEGDPYTDHPVYVIEAAGAVRDEDRMAFVAQWALAHLANESVNA